MKVSWYAQMCVFVAHSAVLSAPTEPPAQSTVSGESKSSTDVKLRLIDQARIKYPSLRGLSDEQALDVIHGAFYADMDKAELARRLGVEMRAKPEPRKPADLSAFSRWRFESCQQDAAMAPTAEGVRAGMRVCREKFDQ